MKGWIEYKLLNSVNLDQMILGENVFFEDEFRDGEKEKRLILECKFFVKLNVLGISGRIFKIFSVKTASIRIRLLLTLLRKSIGEYGTEKIKFVIFKSKICHNKAFRMLC